MCTCATRNRLLHASATRDHAQTSQNGNMAANKQFSRNYFCSNANPRPFREIFYPRNITPTRYSIPELWWKQINNHLQSTAIALRAINLSGLLTSHSGGGLVWLTSYAELSPYKISFLLFQTVNKKNIANCNTPRMKKGVKCKLLYSRTAVIFKNLYHNTKSKKIVIQLASHRECFYLTLHVYFTIIHQSDYWFIKSTIL